MWTIIADLFECIRLKKKLSQSSHRLTFFNILEIIKYVIFIKLVAINDNEIFVSKVKNFHPQ